ncbi:MAG: hypothetical protein Kilf2KO_41990 [Rhodospirillales bacterium]
MQRARQIEIIGEGGLAAKQSFIFQSLDRLADAVAARLAGFRHQDWIGITDQPLP